MGKLDFLIIGAQKCGTVAAAHNLRAHTEIWVSQRELHFFNDNFDKGLDWYLKTAWAGAGSSTVVGERTPNYLLESKAHVRIKQTFPDIRMICLLRNPIYRAYSQWQMELRKELHNSSFRDRWQQLSTIPPRGHYAIQLEHLFTLFSREQIHIAISEYVLKDMYGEYNKMVAFLGLKSYHPPCERQHVEKYASRMSFEDWKLLYDYYQPHNERLFGLLGYDVPEWSYCSHLIGM